MTTPGGVGAARGDAPTQDAATELVRLLEEARDLDQRTRRAEAADPEYGAEACDHETWECHASGALTGFADAIYVVRSFFAAASPVPVAADVPTPSAATQNDEAQR